MVDTFLCGGIIGADIEIVVGLVRGKSGNVGQHFLPLQLRISGVGTIAAVKIPRKRQAAPKEPAVGSIEDRQGIHTDQHQVVRLLDPILQVIIIQT